MQTSGPHYAVTVEARIPRFENERSFVATEKEFARRELAKLKGKHQGLLAAVIPKVIGAPGVEDWKRYIRDLDHYATKIDEQEAEIAAGLVPVKFFVLNTAGEPDKNIKIRVTVEHGTIHPAKESPNRPPRIDDGPQHVPEQAPTPVTLAKVVSGAVSGFSRRGVKIGRHSVEAEFSRLEGNDSAYLVHQVVFVDGVNESHFTFDISSDELAKPQRGAVEVN